MAKCSHCNKFYKFWADVLVIVIILISVQNAIREKSKYEGNRVYKKGRQARQNARNIEYNRREREKDLKTT